MDRKTPVPLPDLDSLRDTAISLVEGRTFARARQMIETLFELGVHAPTMQLAYATCLIEMNEGSRAADVLSALEAHLSSLPQAAQRSLRAALNAISEMLPGNRWDPTRLSGLKGDAERMVPTLGKDT